MLDAFLEIDRIAGAAAVDAAFSWTDEIIGFADAVAEKEILLAQAEAQSKIKSMQFAFDAEKEAHKTEFESELSQLRASFEAEKEVLGHNFDAELLATQKEAALGTAVAAAALQADHMADIAQLEAEMASARESHTQFFVAQAAAGAQ